jgi:hypothetical protein
MQINLPDRSPRLPRKPFALMLLAVLLGTGGAHAAFSPDKGFGVGFILGVPTGISEGPFHRARPSASTS